jgi:O-glycosyl hydrolase
MKYFADNMKTKIQLLFFSLLLILFSISDTSCSARIQSNITGSLQNVALVTPNGKKVLIVENDGTTLAKFNISFQNEWITTSLDAGSVGTYVW